MEMIRSSPVFNKILNYAHKHDGSVKFYDPADTRIIEKGDAIFTIGERGEKLLRSMQKLGVTAESLNEKLEK